MHNNIVQVFVVTYVHIQIPPAVSECVIVIMQVVITNIYNICN